MSDVETAVLRPVTPLGILAERLDRLRADLAGNAETSPEVITELDGICELASGLDPYLDRCTSPASEPLRRLVERTERADWGRSSEAATSLGLEAEMLSGHVEGQLLAFLVRHCRARRVLEIGMFTGYSALAMAEALPEGGRVVACEIDPDVARFARSCFDDSPHGDSIEIVVGPATDALRSMAAAGDSFDLVFIDADKAGYRDYLNILLDGDLLAASGLICVDNTLMQGQAYVSGEATANGEAIARFNEQVAADVRVEQVLLAVRDGVTLIRRV